ncbi:carbonic anhydrase [Collybia nuda]|uniref:Carbonic anhydrase n=1 Tax=Collybia nuda TaxID=64659 RepID=A0A9P5XWK3_9AGAR|nr:carbonic anhydrase [Collybia nuda]
MLLDCSDTRVGEQSIFSAKPKTMFTTGNIASQCNETDLSSKSVLSYAVSMLGVKHAIVMGHYGCGGVGAAIMRKPCEGEEGDTLSGAVQSWIRPIRAIYQNSRRYVCFFLIPFVLPSFLPPTLAPPDPQFLIPIPRTLIQPGSVNMSMPLI